MAVKFRHKETGLFFCRAKGLSPSIKMYNELGEEAIFRKEIFLREEESMRRLLKIKKYCGLEKNMRMNLKL